MRNFLDAYKAVGLGMLGQERTRLIEVYASTQRRCGLQSSNDIGSEPVRQTRFVSMLNDGKRGDCVSREMFRSINHFRTELLRDTSDFCIVRGYDHLIYRARRSRSLDRPRNEWLSREGHNVFSRYSLRPAAGRYDRENPHQ